MTLDARLRRFDNTRVGLMREMTALDPASLAATPGPGTWSMLQIVEHLVVAERVVYRGLPDPASLVPLERTLGHRWRYPLVMSILRLGVPVRAPSRAMNPDGAFSLHELGRMWDDNQQWLHAVRAWLGRDQLHAAVLAHPIAGPMTIEQGVRMGQVHIDRHIRRIRELQLRVAHSPRRTDDRAVR